MNPAGVMIHKMYLTGDVSQKNAFLHSLDNQNWFGEDSQQIIFIKKIQVQGQWWEIARKIAQETHQWQNADAEQIVFANYAQMAAEFIRLLLSANQPWYLESWLQQEQLPAEPITILIHKINEIPSILKQLQDNKSGSNKLLSDLFLSFNLNDLQKLQHALIALHPTLQYIHNLSIDNIQTTQLNFPQSAEKWIREFCKDLLQPQCSKKEIEIIVSIISCMSAWRFAPQWLNDIEGFQIWHSQIHQLYRENIHPTLTLPLARGGDRFSHLQTNDDNSLLLKTTANFSPSPQPDFDSPSPLLKKGLGGGDALPQFIIHQTGLLFFINLLNPEKSPLSLTLSHKSRRTGERVINPWIILHQLFLKIAEEFSFSIEASMQNCLIEISGLTVDEFHEQSTDNSVVLEFYEQLRQKLQRMNLWQSDWFFLSAIIEVDQAHVRCYLDNSAVRLYIRRTGLDINPGWVPWLGRVINFHYGSYPELQMQGTTV